MVMLLKSHRAVPLALLTGMIGVPHMWGMWDFVVVVFPTQVMGPAHHVRAARLCDDFETRWSAPPACAGR